ncbi:MAG: DUF302 domain-containing protein [Vicinamibacterales bacterium]
MPASLGFEVELPLDFAAALTATREALKAEGFGVISEIDFQAAFKDKLGREFRPYTVLGACNPPLAFAAVNEDPVIGLLLPCNVTVEAQGDHRAVVRLVDPRTMLAAAPAGLSPTLTAIAEDAHGRIERVAAALRRTGDDTRGV